MESRKLSEDVDSSFELFEPINVQTTPAMPSIPTSMSIVTIPDEYRNATVNDINERQMTDVSNVLQLSQNISFNDNESNLDTKTIDSMDSSLKNKDNIEEQELLASKLSNLEKQLGEELNTSVTTLSTSNSLSKIESNFDFNSAQFSDNLEKNLKELRDENEKLKSALEKNNQVMKQQLKNLQEWQIKNNQTTDENKRMIDESKTIVQQLREENMSLKDQVLNLEGMAGLKLIEELGTEVVTLRSKCDQLTNYQKLDVESEMQAQEVCAQLVDAKRTIDSMNHQIESLRMELNETNSKLESLPILSSQLETYERDFKIEEMAKLAALKEVDELEKEIEALKKSNCELGEKLEKGTPAVDLKAEPTVGRHHRSHRHSGKLHRSPIPVLGVGAVLKGFKQYKTTTNNA